MDIGHRPEVSEPGRPVQQLVVETLYRCRRSVTLSSFLPIRRSIRNFQTHRSSKWLSRSRHVTRCMLSHRLIRSRSRRTSSSRYISSIRCDNSDSMEEGVGDVRPAGASVFLNTISDSSSLNTGSPCLFACVASRCVFLLFFWRMTSLSSLGRQSLIKNKFSLSLLFTYCSNF